MATKLRHLHLFSPGMLLALAFGLGAAIESQASSITLDESFSPPFFAAGSPGKAIGLPDGKYVDFFNVDSVTDRSTGPLVRFNNDGTLDTTFAFSAEFNGVLAVAAAPGGKLIIAAFKTIYGVAQPTQIQAYDILRLNPDGSIDPTFAPAQSTSGGEVRTITVNADGTILVAGKFTRFNGIATAGIVRLLPDGAMDPSFAPVTMTCAHPSFDATGTCGLWTAPVLDADNKILIVGDFVSVDGVAAPGIARLHSDGTLDNTFSASGFSPWLDGAGRVRPIRGIVIQSDNKIVIGGRFTVSASFASNPTGSTFKNLPLVRLEPDGTVDQSYGYFGFVPAGRLDKANRQIDGLRVEPGDKVIAIGGSVWRFNSDGSLDSSFSNPDLLVLQQDCGLPGCAGAYNISGQGDGKLLIAGVFTDINDAAGPSNGERWGVAKLNSDGTLDTGFTTSHRTGNKIEPASFLRLSNGSTFIAFARYDFADFETIPHNFGRLLANGALDLGFDPIASFDPNGPLGPGFVSLGFTPLSDGSLLLTGTAGQSASYGHLLASGLEDTNYVTDPNITFATAFPRQDGKVVLSNYDLNRTNTFADPIAQAAANGAQIQRINSNGSVDGSFHLDSTVVADCQQRDVNGNLTALYIGSGVLALTANNTTLFGYLSRDGSYHLVRVNNDGSVDPSFTGATFPVSLGFYFTPISDPQHPEAGLVMRLVYYPLELPVKQARPVLDGKVVLMGSFASYGNTSAHGLLRVNSNGSADSTFSIGSGAQWTQTQETVTFHPSIDNLEVGLDDKLLLTGTFEAFNGTAAPGIISLNPDGTLDPSFVPPVKRQKFDYQPAYLARQSDGSFLLSGPYSRATDNLSPSFFRLLLAPGAPTPAGSYVSVNEGAVGSASNITVDFDAVAQAGNTSVSVIDPNWAGQLPPGFQVAGPDVAFEVYTTSSYTGPITVCFTLASLDDPTFAIARILHNNGNGLVDVTSSKDAVTKTICATVSSLSPFVVVKPPYLAAVQAPIAGDGSSVFTAKRGVVPVKFYLSAGGRSTCVLPPATIAVIRLAGANLGAVNESSFIAPADSGSSFRIEGCQYGYNLNATGLGAGTYRVDLKIGSKVAGSATFQLK
jgi:uncharacterized delta-60 repeat protein